MTQSLFNEHQQFLIIKFLPHSITVTIILQNFLFIPQMHLPYILLAAVFLVVAHAATIPLDLVAQESELEPAKASTENEELVRSKRGLLLAKAALVGGGLLAGKAALIGGGILGAKALVGAGLVGGLYHGRR